MASFVVQQLLTRGICFSYSAYTREAMGPALCSSRATKICIYKSVVKSIATHDVELWDLSQRNKTKIKAVGMNY